VESLAFGFFYLDKQGKLAESGSWPPDNFLSDPQGGGGYVPERQYLLLPRIIEFKITTQDLGTVSRKFLIANCFVDVYHPSPQGSAAQGGGCGS
jgi:hypothetical protein